MSWWKHFELEIPRLVELGFTNVWLPPPNKAAKPVSHELWNSYTSSLSVTQSGRGYDAYDLVCYATYLRTLQYTPTHDCISGISVNSTKRAQ